MSEPHQKSKIADLRSWYLGRLGKTAKWFIAHLDTQGIPRPTTLQEIPPLAKEMLNFIKYPDPTDTYVTTKGEVKTYGEANPAKELVQMSLEIAKELKLLESGMDLPLRRIWYAFVKAALERGLAGFVYTKASKEKAGEQREAADSDYYDGFGDIIKSSSDLWYDVYGIKNTGKLTFVPTSFVSTEGERIGVSLGDMFNPIMIGVEKTSYFQVLKNMCNMLGLALYAAGGQSSVSASEEIMKRVDPIMKEKGEEHLDIYAITDFDPAGYSIAKGIYKHSKLFIERFGGTVDFERLAPLPKHYTDIELEQGLYTVKKQWTEPTTHTFKRGKRKGETETKGHWGYNPVDRLTELPEGVKLGAIEVIEEREAEGEIKFERKRLEYAAKSKKDAKKPHEKGDPILDKYGNEQWYISQGLEIESLPEEPLEELLKHPPSEMPYSYTGIARMRFIVFDDIIERHGLEGAFKFLIGLKKREWTTYSGESLVKKVVNVKNVKKIDEMVSDADSPFWELHTNLELWIQSYIEDEKKKVAEDIDEWINDVIEQYTDSKHKNYDKDITNELVKELKDKIYGAIAKNSSSISFSFPEEFKIEKVEYYEKKEDNYYNYDEKFEITIPDEIVENIKPIADFAKCIAINAQEAVDYLEELQEDLEEDEHIFDRKWEIPPVRACRINEEGEAEFVDIETIEGDCREYQKQIRKLHDDIADLEWEYEKEIMEMEKEIGGEEYEILAEERLKKISDLAEERQKKIGEWEDKYVKLNMRYRELQDVIDKQTIRLQELKGAEKEIKELQESLEETEADYSERTKQLQEAHQISLEYVKKAEAKIKKLQKQIKTEPIVPKAVKKEEIEKTVAEKYIEMKELKQKKKEEREKKALEINPFRFWEESDITKRDKYKERIKLYYTHTQDTSKAIQKLIDEKIGAMEKLYKKGYPKTQETIGQERIKQLSLLSGDLNRLNTDIKKLYHYGR